MPVFCFVRSAPVALLVALSVLLAPAVVTAQQPASTAIPSGPMTLDQVLDLAATRSESIAIALAGVRRAEGEQVRARSALFPQLTLSGGYDRALASEFSGLFDNFG